MSESAPTTRLNPESNTLNLVFAALADPVRREILMMLDEKEMLVGEVAREFEISMQAISKHIQVLVRAGLVTQERSGRINRCRLDAEPIGIAAQWINHYAKYWQHQFDTLVAFLPELDNKDQEP